MNITMKKEMNGCLWIKKIRIVIIYLLFFFYIKLTPLLLKIAHGLAEAEGENWKK